MSSQVDSVLGNHQPQAGLAWTDRIPAPAMRGKTMRHLCFEWMESDPVTAERAALALTDAALRPQLMENAALTAADRARRAR